jgi:hypothetical protein
LHTAPQAHKPRQNQASQSQHGTYDPHGANSSYSSNGPNGSYDPNGSNVHNSSYSGDPRIGWIAAADSLSATAPVLLHRRDGIMPAVAAALSIRGETLTCTGSKGENPPTHHPLVQDFLDTLTTERRTRQTGRCPEAVLLSRHLTATETARAEKRNGRGKSAKNSKTSKTSKGTNGKATRPAKPPKPLTLSEAKRALKHAKLTARRIREDGDPLHGSYAPPCRSCGPLLAHFGVRTVDPAQESTQ